MVDEAELVAVCSRDIAKAMEFARLYGAKKWTTDRKQLIESDDVDAIVVTGPPELHLDVIAECLEAKRPVFSEKPIGYTAADAAKLAAQADDCPTVVTFVGYNFALSAPLLRLVNRLNGQANIQLAKLKFISNKPTERLWKCQNIIDSFMLAVGVHPIEMVIRGFGEPKNA